MTARKEELVSASGTGDEVLDVIVVGGSQAGLAMAWHLARLKLRFVVLEAAPEIGHSWRSRWDSLTLFTPTQYDALPGLPFPGPPDTYPTKDPVASYLTAYAAEFNLPVRLNARVTALIRTAEGFEARTDDGVFRARQVVVATGPFQAPVERVEGLEDLEEDVLREILGLVVFADELVRDVEDLAPVLTDDLLPGDLIAVQAPFDERLDRVR